MIPPAPKSKPKNTRQTNVLLLKHPGSRDSNLVGKSKPSTFDLPAKDHVYGLKVERNQEGAAQVLTSWNIIHKKQEDEPGLDYCAMNRAAAKAKIITAGDQQKFRQSHPIRRQKANPQYELESPLPSKKDASYTYGKPTRPSTPVGRLMTDFFQEEWIRSQEKKAQEEMQAEKERLESQRQRAIKSNELQAQLHHRSKKIIKKCNDPNQDPKSLFRLSKFKTVPSRIESHRPINDIAIIKYKPELQQ